MAVNGQLSSSSTVQTVGGEFKRVVGGVAVAGSGDVFIGDSHNYAVKELPWATAPSHTFPTATAVGSTYSTNDGAGVSSIPR